MYTYWILNSNNEFGYEVLKNGKLMIRQCCSPNYEGTPIDSIRTSEQMAKLIIVKLNTGLNTVITKNEEDELKNGVVTDERINEIVLGYMGQI